MNNSFSSSSAMTDLSLIDPPQTFYRGFATLPPVLLTVFFLFIYLFAGNAVNCLVKMAKRDHT